MREQNDTFYSVGDDCERLMHQHPDEAIEEFFDHAWPGPRENPPRTTKEREAWHDRTLTLYEWQREERPGEPRHPDYLERLLEYLDEEHGDPENATEPTEAMREAEKRFITTVCALYVPWTCKIVKRTEINGLEWVREHCPEWLEGGDAA